MKDVDVLWYAGVNPENDNEYIKSGWVQYKSDGENNHHISNTGSYNQYTYYKSQGIYEMGSRVGGI